MEAPYGLVFLNKYPEIGNRFYDSLVEFESDLPKTVAVLDNHDGRDLRTPGAEVVSSYGPFIFSRNVNIGIRHLDPLDIILCNDDVTFVSRDTLKKLSERANKSANIGMAAPLVDGGVGSPYQDWNQTEKHWKPGKLDGEVRGKKWDSTPICFIVVYLKRKMINEIGLLDESFTGYGFDDTDYTIRARRNGWRTIVTGATHVKHGIGGKDLDRGTNWNLTYSRTPNLQSNLPIFLRKWNPAKLKEQQV